MSDIATPFVKFIYTVLDPDGDPVSRSWVINLNYIVSVEVTTNEDVKVHLTNHQTVIIEPGKDLSANSVADEILSHSAAGKEFSVFKVERAVRPAS